MLINNHIFHLQKSNVLFFRTRMLTVVTNMLGQLDTCFTQGKKEFVKTVKYNTITKKFAHFSRNSRGRLYWWLFTVFVKFEMINANKMFSSILVLVPESNQTTIENWWEQKIISQSKKIMRSCIKYLNSSLLSESQVVSSFNHHILFSTLTL